MLCRVCAFTNLIMGKTIATYKVDKHSWEFVENDIYIPVVLSPIVIDLFK